MFVFSQIPSEWRSRQARVVPRAARGARVARARAAARAALHLAAAARPAARAAPTQGGSRCEYYRLLLMKDMSGKWSFCMGLTSKSQISSKIMRNRGIYISIGGDLGTEEVRSISEFPLD